ncbi:MAG TPA: VWA domain-containing protein [Candidatus Saccharimonadales bacterium]|jgi:hypothetical protein
MELIFWWMLILWALGIAGYWGTRYWLINRNGRRLASLSLPVAHSNRLTSLPEYAAALKKYQLLVNCTAGVLSLVLLAAILLTARPAAVSVITPVQQNRDIMLCLDASGSVLREDTTLIDRFSSLVSSFSGQRFGLTLFNSSAVTVIPLNDDYPLISKQLKTAAQAFKVQSGTTFAQLTNGTLAGFSQGTSLVSDGLTSCIDSMGTNSGHRPQSIILATDNEVNGTPIVDMLQAVALARQHNIRLFAIDPGVSDQSLADDHGQLKTITKETGGDYYSLSNLDNVDSVIGDISAQQSGNFVGLPQYATNDIPQPFLYGAALLTIITIGLLWRLEL